MKVISCAVCGILFDIYNAQWCNGHLDPPVMGRQRFCKVCPMGHPLHSLEGWVELPRRAATDEEREHGFQWMLEDVPVGLHEFTTRVASEEEHAEIRDALRQAAEKKEQESP